MRRADQGNCNSIPYRRKKKTVSQQISHFSSETRCTILGLYIPPSSQTNSRVWCSKTLQLRLWRLLVQSKQALRYQVQPYPIRDPFVFSCRIETDPAGSVRASGQPERGGDIEDRDKRNAAEHRPWIAHCAGIIINC